jgi:hypothetical protein
MPPFTMVLKCTPYLKQSMFVVIHGILVMYSKKVDGLADLMQ